MNRFLGVVKVIGFCIVLLALAACGTASRDAPQDTLGTQSGGAGVYGYATVSARAALLNSFNTEGSVSSVRSGLGRYHVTFEGLGGSGEAGAHIQVTAGDNTLSLCKVRNWFSTGSDLTAYVDCYNPTTGGVKDASFSILATWPPVATGEMSYAWVNTNAAVSSLYMHNSAGASASARRVATGRYQVRFPGAAGTAADNVQVTSYGSTYSSCQLEGWYGSGADLLVNVACFNAAGNLFNSAFNVLVNWQSSFAAPRGFSWAHHPASNPYIPLARYNFNASGRPVSITRNYLGTTGRYLVRYEGLGSIASNAAVQVSPYGSGARALSCQTQGWRAAGADLLVDVLCHNKPATIWRRADNVRFSVFVLGARDDCSVICIRSPSDGAVYSVVDGRVYVEGFYDTPAHRAEWLITNNRTGRDFVKFCPPSPHPFPIDGYGCDHSSYRIDFSFVEGRILPGTTYTIRYTAYDRSNRVVGSDAVTITFR